MVRATDMGYPLIDELIRELSDARTQNVDRTAQLAHLLSEYIRFNSELQIRILRHLKNERQMSDSEIDELIADLEVSMTELSSE